MAENPELQKVLEALDVVRNHIIAQQQATQGGQSQAAQQPQTQPPFGVRFAQPVEHVPAGMAGTATSRTVTIGWPPDLDPYDSD